MDARGEDPRGGVQGTTALMKAITEGKEETARWMVANGADVKATESDRSTVFANACAHMSCDFVRELADKLPPEHLAMPNKFNHTPMYYAAVDNSRSVTTLCSSSPCAAPP